MTVNNTNDFNAPEVEIVATNTSNDEGLEDVTALPFGHDAEEHRNQMQQAAKKGGYKIILIGTAAILALCVTVFSAAAVSSNNAIAHSFNFNAAPKSSKAKVTKSSKTPKASTQAPTQAPTPDCAVAIPVGCSAFSCPRFCLCESCPQYVIRCLDCQCSCAEAVC